MQQSANYGLKLPEGTDNVKRQDFVDNFTNIDIQMKAINDNSYPDVTATGTNTYVGTTDKITALSKGTKLTLFVGTDATGSCTLNLNSYGAKSIKDSFGNIVTNLKANIPYNLCYNGTDFILQGKGGGGNAIASHILAGETATVDSGQITGILDLSNLVTGNIKSGVTINGVAGKSTVVDTAGANLAAGYMLSGANGYTNGSLINGNIPNHSEADSPANSIAGTGAGRMYVRPQQGYYDGNVASYVDDGNFAAANIISGKSIFGLAGSAPILWYATGTTNGTRSYLSGNANAWVLNLSGVTSFVPDLVLCESYIVLGGSGGTKKSMANFTGFGPECEWVNNGSTVDSFYPTYFGTKDLAHIPLIYWPTVLITSCVVTWRAYKFS